jgi:hypothetical protein
MHSVAETSVFTRRADALLSAEERFELITLLAAAPLAGVVIPSTGGVRKLRFAARGQGKRGGFRVIYYVLTDDLPLVAITIYGKNEKADLTEAERRGARAIVNAMKSELQQRQARR